MPAAAVAGPPARAGRFTRPDDDLDLARDVTDAVLTLDGQKTVAVAKDSAVEIRQCALGAKFIRFEDDSFFRVLRRKLSGSDPVAGKS